jgi:glycosyl transferase family 25
MSAIFQTFELMAIPAFLINLDRSSDRLEAMTGRLSQLGLSCERVSAIDGRMLGEKDLAAVRTTVRGWTPLSAAEVGCFLSHRKCWELIAAQKDEYGCIFEDDVVFSPHMSGFLSSSGWIPRNADVIKLEAAGDRVWLDARAVALADGFQLSRLRSTHYRAGGYILSRNAANFLLSRTRTFSAPVDLILFDPAFGIASKIVIYQVLPALCAQAKHLYLAGSAGFVETTIAERGSTHREGWLARRAHWAEREGRKLWHRLNQRERTVVEFDGCE